MQGFRYDFSVDLLESVELTTLCREVAKMLCLTSPLDSFTKITSDRPKQIYENGHTTAVATPIEFNSCLMS